MQLAQHCIHRFSLHLGYPSPEQPPVPQEIQGRFGNGWDTAESCCWHILPSSAAGIPTTCICIVTPSNK